MKEEYFEYIENQRKNKIDSQNERQNYLMKKAKFEHIRNNKITVSAIMIAIIGIIIFLTKDLIQDYFNELFAVVYIIVGAISFSIGIGALLYRYLQNGSFSALSDLNNSEQNFRYEIQDLKVEILKLRKKSGEPTDSENISKTINNAIDNTLTEKFIKDKIDGFYSEKAIIESRHQNLLEDFESLSYRINGELTRLRKSANLNLVIGTLTTALAITALAYEVFKSEFEIIDTVKLLTHYLPRLSLIIFIEIFAFFFLKLYKSTLSDIKYFNNEKTNIDFKLISLKTALNFGDTKMIKSMLQELIRTERNFKLGKNESTVELEKVKSEMNNNKILAQLFEKIQQGK